ncbi:MAG TPA: hypothetical protein VEP49_12140 [Acidimicrobiia bacterium]|nr:hypothetical protein [Acidimicrobiia bacterium]
MNEALPLRVHAIYAVLDEVPLFRASVASIYPYVSGITVITAHDRDWLGERREPGRLVSTILGRHLDPERKIDLIVTNEINEARARNRAMDYAAPRSRSVRVVRQHDRDPGFEPPDYFLIIDADEIYEGVAMERLIAYVARDRRRVYRVPCVRYFKRWNYRIEGYEWAFAFVRADWRIQHIRGRRANIVRRGAAHIPGMPAAAAARLRGFVDIPADVGVFHHGSYVGPRERIAAKLGSFGHQHQVPDGWLTDVYDPWTPDARDFNPAFPDLFPSAERLDVEALPAEIVDRAWPSDYLER